MKTARTGFAVAELLLMVPALLFLLALFMRNLQPSQYEPARTAVQIVAWYAARPRTGLWIFMLGLPLTALLTGGFTLIRRWRNEFELRDSALRVVKLLGSHLATLMVACATLAAGGVLSIVALHLLAD